VTVGGVNNIRGKYKIDHYFLSSISFKPRARLRGRVLRCVGLCCPDAGRSVPSTQAAWMSPVDESGWEAQEDGFPHIHCILLFREAELETFFYNGKWRLSRKRELEKYWSWGFSDMFAMYSLGAGVGYVMKYVTKVNNALLAKKRNRKDVLSLALMWIFRKRAFSVSKDFGVYLVEVQEERHYGQVDLEGKTIYKWHLVGFWADVDGEYSSWSVQLSSGDFSAIQSSDFLHSTKCYFLISTARQSFFITCKMMFCHQNIV